MILDFILLKVQQLTDIPPPTHGNFFQISAYIIAALLTFTIAYFQTENKRKYRKLQDMKLITYQNQRDIADIKAEERSFKEAFITYQKMIAERNKISMDLLIRIDDELKRHNKTTNDLRVEVAKIKK